MICDSLIAQEVHFNIVLLYAICENDIYVGVLLISSSFPCPVLRLMTAPSLSQNKLFKVNELLAPNISIDINIYNLRVVILLFRLFQEGSQLIPFCTFLAIRSMYRSYCYVLTSVPSLEVDDVEGLPLRIEYIPCSLSTNILSC